MPFETWKDIGETPIEERISYFKDALRKAVNKVLVEDTDLIAAGAHEQSITNRIGICLQHFLPDTEPLNPEKPSAGRITVDAEYNRSGGDPKTYRPTLGTIPKLFRPDLVVHSRLFADSNYLAVEAKLLGRLKKWRKRQVEDKVKIVKLVQEGQYLYNLGALITICSPKWYIRGNRHAAMIIRWYTRSVGWSDDEPHMYAMSDALLEVAMRRKR